MDLYTKFRQAHPTHPEPSEFMDIIDAEVRRALQFGHDVGWQGGFARAKEFWTHKKFKMHIDKKEDGYWLIIDEAVKLGAEAPQSREVAQATASESTEETTPSGATDPKPEVAP